jgi:hypothetical protein
MIDIWEFCSDCRPNLIASPEPSTSQWTLRTFYRMAEAVKHTHMFVSVLSKGHH